MITGEPGAGKTWLLRKLVEGLPSGWRSVHVDVALAMDAIEFLRLMGHSLGVSMPNHLGEARLLLQSTLQDEATDGRSWLLVVDEAHRGSAQVWDEIHAIRNQLGLKTGFAALFVLGQTELARALSTRRFTGFATSLQAKLHLMPIDLDDARELLSFRLRDGTGEDSFLEELHRNARAIPANCSGWPTHGRQSCVRPPCTAVCGPAPLFDTSQVGERLRSGAGSDCRSAGFACGKRPNDPPLLIHADRPSALEEGLVEVGWEGDLDSEPTHEEEPRTRRKVL